ncbi:hypothetical protein NESM_000653100 [Novymonas esmeraldas]|uniref:Uncharacterized protein n=1 Tax=Novymonas esmeraldas TaxID=1808958 RepID=A0AAW0ETM2_9TRYP
MPATTPYAATPMYGGVDGSGTSGESVDVKDSFDRIEELLNRGQQLLYGDEAADGAAASPDGEPADAGAAAYGSYPSSSYKDPRNYGAGITAPAGLPPRSSAAAAAASSPSHSQLASRSQRDAENPYQRLLQESNLRLPRKTTSKQRGSRAIARAGTTSTGSKRRLSRSKKDEEEEMSASARGRQIAQIQREGGRLPNLEEGVDASDTVQNLTIEELKERIRRELDEYQRSGPLMQRRPSYQRQQRAAAAKRAAIKTKGATKSPVPPARQQAPRVVPRSRGGAPHTAPARSAAASPSSLFATSASAAKPGVPARTVSRSVARSSSAAPPFWERLYRDGAAQQQKRDQRAEQRRVEEEKEHAAVKPRRVTAPLPPPVHSTYSAYYRPLQMDTGSRSGSYDLQAKSAPIPPQRTSYLPRTQARSPLAAATSKSSTAPTSQLSTDAPARIAALRRPSAPSGAQVSGSAKPPAVPLAPPLKPKIEEEEEQQQQHATHNRERYDDIEELSSPDEMDDRSASQPYVAPLDLSKIKK